MEAVIARRPAQSHVNAWEVWRFIVRELQAANGKDVIFNVRDHDGSSVDVLMRMYRPEAK